MQQIIRELIPPLLLKITTNIHHRLFKVHPQPPSPFAYGVEQPPEFYDHTYQSKAHWKKHYTASHYYPLWTVIADRIRHLRVNKVVDIGCGPGQVACLLRDIQVPDYIGLDFSPARIAKARSVCPEYEFRVADIFKNNLLALGDYDCVLIMEFLEHIEQDLTVLNQVFPSTIVLGT
ncbi:class I SAM-dependent methyltransferase [Spirulina major]|uniref:class I SAM-dependent methyltransferase n=1 Tax=Spirulina major TaxID=270636 RepID=UPI0009341B27|nr:class I SAM-dependent methyltransferase [Spirulina major]